MATSEFALRGLRRWIARGGTASRTLGTVTYRKPKTLQALKVVESGTLIAGLFLTRILAEFGAEVIKPGITGWRCCSGNGAR